MKLSEHLELSEIIRSESAKRRGILNMPTVEHIKNLQLIAENIFEPIRLNFRQSIRISSGYRSQSLNAAIGGATHSQHSTGEALDIDMDGTTLSNKEIFNFIKDKLSFDQLIWEFGTDKNPDWVHVSYSANGNQRNQVLKAIKENGKTKLIPYK
jgi:hypothetical protein